MMQSSERSEPPSRYLSARPAMRGRYLIRSPWASYAVRIVDAVVDAAFALRPLRRSINTPHRILICNWAHLGDVLMAFGAVEWIRKVYPEAEIGFLCGSWSKPLVAGATPTFDHVHVADHFMLARSGTLPQRIIRHVRTMAVAARELRAKDYDVAIDLYPFFPSAAPLLWRARIPNRIGWTSGGLSGFLTQRVPFSPAGRHMRDTNTDLLSRLATSDQRPQDLGTALLEPVARGALPYPLNDEKSYVAVHMGAGKRHKEWEDAHWRTVVGELVRDHRVVLLGSGHAENERAEGIKRSFPTSVNLSGALNWEGFEAVISGADLLIGLDSVAGHLAARYGVPTVTIMGGMTDPQQWSPASPYSAVVSHPTPCSPCNRHGCAHMHCILGVKPEAVLAATQSALTAKMTGGDASPRSRVARDALSMSIVIVNHNYGRYLEAAINSALGQQGDDIRVIVVDDGSTDNSRDIIARFGGRVTAILQSQGGHVRAVNAGFAEVKSELVIFLDADDQLYPHCVADVRAAWRPGLAKLQFQLDTINAEGVDQNMPFPHFSQRLTPQEILRQSLRFGVYPWTVSSGNVYYRRYLDQLLPIDAEIIYKSPDGYLNKMAPLFGPVFCLKKVLGAYRVHGANAWAQGHEGFRLEPIRRWLHFDIVLHREFLENAAKRGYRGARYDEVRSTQQLEHRLLSFRLLPKEHPVSGDTRWKLLFLSMKSSFQNANSGPLGKLLWTLWLCFLAVAPSKIAAATFTRYRGQTDRDGLARLLLHIDRGQIGPRAKRATTWN